MTIRLPLSPLAVVAILLGFCATASAQLIETRAPHAFMVEAETGTVLFSKDPEKQIPPAALAKLMAMEVVFHELKAGRVSLDDTYKVSEHAWRTGGAPSGGSTMFAELNSEIRLEDLIKGVVIQSANDGCIIIAEGMAGSMEKFVQMMNERAQAIGLTRSHFENAHGLPAEGQVVSVQDLAILAQHLWREYPDYYRYYGMTDFTWNKIFQRNRNPLLRADSGADGLGTGYTDESGFAIVGSAERDGRRLFLAMSGMATDKERAEEAVKMLNWGFRAFEKRDLFQAGETVGEAKVFGGTKGGVALTARGPLSILVPTAGTERMSARIVYRGPLKAPIVEGTPVGELRVWIGETLTQETPLFAAENIDRGTLSQRALDAVEELAIGWIR